MNDEPNTTPEDDDEVPGHVHRWSLLKDREFYEMSDVISRYLIATHPSSDCPHTDSPLVDAMETMAAVYWKHAPLPDAPALRSVFMELLQTIGNQAFTAGIRFAVDGQKLDNHHEITKCEIPEQPSDMKWDDKTAELVREWREAVREENYFPPDDGITDEQRAVLETLVGQKIPKGARVMFNSGGGFAISVPRQPGEEYRPGTYL